MAYAQLVAEGVTRKLNGLVSVVFRWFLSRHDSVVVAPWEHSVLYWARPNKLGPGIPLDLRTLCSGFALATLARRLEFHRLRLCSGPAVRPPPYFPAADR